MPPYAPTDWSDGATPVDAVHMDKIEAGIAAAQIVEEKGVANGYAALDATGKVPAAQLPVAGAPIPVGSVVDFAGAVAPAGWLICNGASLLRSSYPLLFAVIGTSYGAVDGTHFSLPDARGRMSVGVGTRPECDAVGDSDNLALASRRPQHRHTVNETAHGHGVTDNGHNHGVNDPGHSHAIPVYNRGGGRDVIGRANSADDSYEAGIRSEHVGVGIWLNASGTGIGINGGFTGVTVGNAADYLDAPPYITFNKIIRGD